MPIGKPDARRRVGLHLNTAELIAKWRALSPGKSVAIYWGGLALLVLMAGVPFFLLSATATTSEAERSSDSRLTGAVGASSTTTPDALSSPSFSAGSSASPSPDGTVIQTPVGGPVRPLPANAVASADDRGADFDIQCWPTLAVSPGRSTTIDCNIPVYNGDGSEIALACQVTGMACVMSPDRVQPLEDRRTLTAKLTVSAPASAPVGLRRATVVATGGETGASLEQADVDVNVPPPFSVSCESIGATFVQGAEARIKCWVTFMEDSDDVVSLSIKDPGRVAAGLDALTLTGTLNQTKVFSIVLDTERIAPGNHSVRLGATTPRYEQEAWALFEIRPA